MYAVGSIRDLDPSPNPSIGFEWDFQLGLLPAFDGSVPLTSSASTRSGVSSELESSSCSESTSSSPQLLSWDCPGDYFSFAFDDAASHVSKTSLVTTEENKGLASLSSSPMPSPSPTLNDEFYGFLPDSIFATETDTRILSLSSAKRSWIWKYHDASLDELFQSSDSPWRCACCGKEYKRNSGTGKGMRHLKQVHGIYC